MEGCMKFDNLTKDKAAETGKLLVQAAVRLVLVSVTFGLLFCLCQLINMAVEFLREHMFPLLLLFCIVGFLMSYVSPNNNDDQGSSSKQKPNEFVEIFPTMEQMARFYRPRYTTSSCNYNFPQQDPHYDDSGSRYSSFCSDCEERFYGESNEREEEWSREKEKERVAEAEQRAAEEHRRAMDQGRKALADSNDKLAAAKGKAKKHRRKKALSEKAASEARKKPANPSLEREQRIAERAAKALAEKKMRDLRAQQEQAERDECSYLLDGEIKCWSSGKEGNLRALLSTLQDILRPDSGWKPVHPMDLMTTAAVKKSYRKATLLVHPDKLQQRGATLKEKYLCEKVFNLLKDACDKFSI